MVTLVGSAVAGLAVLGFSSKFYSCSPTKSPTPTSHCICSPFVNTATLLLFSYLLLPVVLSIPLVWGKQYVSGLTLFWICTLMSLWLNSLLNSPQRSPPFPHPPQMSFNDSITSVNSLLALRRTSSNDFDQIFDSNQ